ETIPSKYHPNAIFSYGIDVITMGDHIWKQKDIYNIIDSESRLLRPLNYPSNNPGKGYVILPVDSLKIAVINLVGRVFMQPSDCPFRAALNTITMIKKETPIILVDFHAEATSEKIALGWYLDGMVSAVVGTHTHVQTADERVLPNGTAFITDIGMTGPFDSVLGRDVDSVLKRFVTLMPTRFSIARNNLRLCGVIVTLDKTTGRALEIKRINEPYD
ncbi:YmdB family metallophosphoesterase, partial [Chlamydiota bacterium]